MTLHHYSVHGLRLATPVALNALPLSEGEVADTFIHRLPRSSVPHAPPDGELLQQQECDDHRRFFTRDAHGYRLRLGGALECRISPDAVETNFSLDSRLELAFESVLLSSGVTSLIATLRGGAVLHGGAVRWGGTTVAIVGHSGQGKSTLLTLFCAAGAELLTEDALRIETRGGSCWAYSGTRELRLRTHAGVLSERFESARVSDSCDGRRLVIPSPVAEEKIRIDAFVVPYPSRATVELHLDTLSGSRALSELAQYPRASLADFGQYQGLRFRETARAARVAPVMVAHVPWGPPFAPNLAPALWAQLEERLHHQRSRVAEGARRRAEVGEGVSGS